MKNYDETRQKLKKLGWRRSDRTVNGIHEEHWWTPGRLFSSSYQAACRGAGIKSVPTPQLQDPKPPYRRNKTIQSKHLDTRKVLECIINHCKATGHVWTTYYDLEREFPDWDKFPEHIQRAKMRKLVSKGFLDGCLCGCRGDFEPQVSAYDYLAKNRSRDDIKPGFSATMNGRALRDLWWEGSTLCVQFDDTGAIEKFLGVRVTDYSMEAGCVTMTQEVPLESVPITFVIGDEKK